MKNLYILKCARHYELPIQAGFLNWGPWRFSVSLLKETDDRKISQDHGRLAVDVAVHEKSRVFLTSIHRLLSPFTLFVVVFVLARMMKKKMREMRMNRRWEWQIHRWRMVDGRVGILHHKKVWSGFVLHTFFFSDRKDDGRTILKLYAFQCCCRDQTTKQIAIWPHSICV